MSNKIALVSLDFGGTASMCGDGTEVKPMDRQVFETTITMYVTEVCSRLDLAASAGRAAEACANAGSFAKAVEVTMDIDQLLYEATTLLNAMSLINRIASMD